jgi:hypothetical protein
MSGPVLLNELHYPTSGVDTVELYNPTTQTLSLAGWRLSNGVVMALLNGTIPAHGFVLLTLDPGFDLRESALIYLFDSSLRRADQMGFRDAPNLLSGECLGRIPDGAHPTPNLGYNYATSGGGQTLFRTMCTPGGSNNRASSVPEAPAAVLSWGQLKTRYR